MGAHLQPFSLSVPVRQLRLLLARQCLKKVQFRLVQNTFVVAENQVQRVNLNFPLTQT